MDTLVTAAWLADHLDDPDVRVLDCSVGSVVHDGGGYELASGRGAWADGHIPGSQHVDLLEELSDRDAPVGLMMPAVEQLATALRAAGVDDTTRVVVYDRSMNMWAARLWWMLRAAGFDRAAVLDGGWTAWTTGGRSVARGAGSARAAAGPLTLRPREAAFVDKAAVLRALDDPATCLVDALQPETFRGERDDYGRPGHIPGAHNLPFASLVDPETQCYLPLEQLRELVAEVPLVGAERVVTYCGGGVAASSAALILTMLGTEHVSVYDGSLMEWAADPDLPLVCDEQSGAPSA